MLKRKMKMGEEKIRKPTECGIKEAKKQVFQKVQVVNSVKYC